jgi:1,4-dihydroxy-6-naphthoate synthase
MSAKLALTLGHSPDPDDAFMWWPLTGIDGAGPAIDTGPFDFTVVTDDIESLNRRALHGELDITAISIAHYPQVHDTYVLTACGASVGDGYGPKLVAASPMTIDELRASKACIAVPGEHTTALATTKLLLGQDVQWQAVPFETIGQRVRDGLFQAGVVIHEGQLTFGDSGLHLVQDLGAWWHALHGLVLPLGGNVAKRDIEDRGGPGSLQALAGVLLGSVEHAMANREVSLAWAQRFGRGIDLATADAFVELYVNRWTLDFGASGRAALRIFLGAVHDAGGPDPGSIDIVEPPLRPSADDRLSHVTGVEP